jgi:hypothetical protein
MPQIIATEPAHAVGSIVFVKPTEERSPRFQLPGDDDVWDGVHGPLVVRGVEKVSDGEQDGFVYSLAIDSVTPALYIVPEHAIEA